MSDEKKTIIICENCKTSLRVPVGKGNLRVTCPICKTQFMYYDISETIIDADFTVKDHTVIDKTPKKRKKKTWLFVLAAVFICVILASGSYYLKTGRLFPCAHTWVSATCDSPKACSKCGKTEGYALGHSWKSATCTTAKTCSICGQTSGSPLGHDWIAETNSSPKMCRRCKTMIAKTLPSNGDVFIGAVRTRDSYITIDCSNTNSHYIKLKSTSGKTEFAFFVRAGKKATVSVPAEKYQVFFSCGDNWYGTDYLFGTNASYYKDDNIIDFNQSTVTYTLYPVKNGNLKVTTITADDF